MADDRDQADTGAFVRTLLRDVAVVAGIGLLLVAISGVWPPLVAVESGSMKPHLYRSDLVFTADTDRTVPAAARADTGVVTYQGGQATGYRKLGSYGDVIVFTPGGGDSFVIHRARFWVDAGENWYDRANPAYVDGDSCAAIDNCPAPHAGFITKGDNTVTNPYYDQVSGISDPVRPAQIRATAETRIPWLGWVRLQVEEV